MNTSLKTGYVIMMLLFWGCNKPEEKKDDKHSESGNNIEYVRCLYN